MAKRTAVIDIGSNSVRIVIFEKTSRFAFHLLREAKSRVRIGEGAYTQNGHLTDEAMQRAFETIEEFVALAKAYKCRKILAVATSALRDAPNNKIFLKRISNELHLNIRVIDGHKEAYYGGIAAANMLARKNSVTVDIGGGSTELALIENGIVTKTASLDLGTVRLKELFCADQNTQDAIVYIQKALQSLDDVFLHHNVIGIGGSIRSLANAYMRSIKYPIKVLHGFTCQASELLSFSQNIIAASDKELQKLGIKNERFDVIGAGTLIFTQLLEYLDAKKVTSSSVGVREGVYIEDLLRTQKSHRFPEGINPTMRSIMDRYAHDEASTKLLVKTSLELFDKLADSLKLNKKYRPLLATAASLAEIGIELNYHDFERHSFYLILHSLYGFSHKQTLIIATLVRYHSKKKPSKAFEKKYQNILPKNKKLEALIFILALSRAMLKSRPEELPFKITFEDEKLKLESLSNNPLAKEKIAKINPLVEIEVI